MVKGEGGDGRAARHAGALIRLRNDGVGGGGVDEGVGAWRILEPRVETFLKTSGGVNHWPPKKRQLAGPAWQAATPRRVMSDRPSEGFFPSSRGGRRRSPLDGSADRLRPKPLAGRRPPARVSGMLSAPEARAMGTRQTGLEKHLCPGCRSNQPPPKK